MFRRKGRDEALRCLAIVVGVMLAILVPFAILAPAGVLDALARQATRPLQVESLGASALYVLHGLTGMVLVMGTSSGSQNLVGELPDALATLETILLAASLLAIWIWFARGEPTTPRFLQAAVAAIVAYVAFGKVLSPQYMAWLIPLVPLLGGRRGSRGGIDRARRTMADRRLFPDGAISRTSRTPTGTRPGRVPPGRRPRPVAGGRGAARRAAVGVAAS